MYDLIIRGGTLIDGSGAQPYSADLAVCDGKIAAIGHGLSGAKQVIDAAGLTVTPGFIDSHSHSDKAALTFPEMKEKVEQGITTCIAGQCGDSQAPVRDEATGALTTMAQYLRAVEQTPQGCNMMSFVGHKRLRLTVMGNENRPATARELQQMKALLAEAMEAGALGVSFGLMYNPSCYADTDELVALSRCAAEYGGMVSAHIRNERDAVEEAVAEFIHVLRASGARGVYSHHKACGPQNWGKVRRTMALLEQAAAEGVEIWCDAYPYIASSTSLASAFLAKEYRAGSDEDVTRLLNDPSVRAQIIAENARRWGEDLSFVMVTASSGFPEYNGKTIPEIAALRGESQYDTALNIIRDSRKRNSACFFTMCEEDVKFVLAHPMTMICTDSSVAGNASVYHPRLRGSFPRVLGKYVRQEKIVGLPEMIRKMTALPAQVYSLQGKGQLKEGFDADICVFDADRISDTATFTHCTPGNEGLSYVLVGGHVVVEDGVHNGGRFGGLIKR